MKNMLRLIGVIAVTAMIGLTMTACGGSSDSPPPPPPPPPPDPDSPLFGWTVGAAPIFNLGHVVRGLGIVGSPPEPGYSAAIGPITGGTADDLFGVITVNAHDLLQDPARGSYFWQAAPATPAATWIPTYMHVAGRDHDFDGLYINLDVLNELLRDQEMIGPPPGLVEWPVNPDALVRGDRLTIRGRVATVRSYGNRRINLVRDISATSGIWSHPDGDNIEVLAGVDIPNAPGPHNFTIQWPIDNTWVPAGGGIGGTRSDALFGVVGLVTEGWAGNNLHGSGISAYFIDEIFLERATFGAIPITANSIWRDTEGVMLRQWTASGNTDTVCPTRARFGTEVMIMPQRDGMGEAHRGISFVFGPDTDGNIPPGTSGRHLRAGQWDRFGWVTVVIPAYENHELRGPNFTTHGPGGSAANPVHVENMREWDRGNISLLIAHGWDLGSEGNYLGGATTTTPALVPGVPSPPGLVNGLIDLDAWMPELFCDDTLDVPTGNNPRLFQHGRYISIPMAYFTGAMPARGGRGGITIFSGDTRGPPAPGSDPDPSQNFSFWISHLVFHDGPFQPTWVYPLLGITRP